jgi:phage tail tape-measure protein
VTTSGPKPKVSAKARRGRTIDAGQFKKGDVRDFNPAKVIAEFPLGPREGDWPRHARAALLMIEKDEGDIGTVVSAVVDAIDKDLSRALGSAAAGLAATVATAALAGSAAGSVVPLVGSAIGAAVATTSALAFGAISQARKDDLFPPEDVHLKLAAYPQRPGKIDGSAGTVRFQAKGGNYRADYYWAIA